MARPRWSSSLALSILPAACATMPDDGAHPLVCKDRTLEVRYIGDDAAAALVHDGDTTSTLTQAISASGARYADEARGAELWIKGDEAMLTLPGREREICRFASRE